MDRKAGRDEPGSRTLILDAAEGLFAEHGYTGASTATIAEAAGVTRSLIFHYFPTKQAILATLLRERGLDEALEQIDVPDTEGDVEAALLLLAAQIHHRLRVSERVLQIVLHERAFQPVTQRMVADFVGRLEDVVLITILAALGTDEESPTTRSVANTFAAVLQRDILLRPLEEAASCCGQAAHTCGRALAGDRAVTQQDRTSW